jgi:ubiquinone/menaquinone biosynthesis C-methylase UbiE
VGAVLGRLVEDTRPTLALGVDRERPHVTLAATVATVLRADATALPLADGCVDAALVRLVLRHVVDPPRLVREAARVLRPGGRLFVADADEESLFLDPPPPGFAALKAALLESVRRRGGDPVIGRRLRRLLLEAGLVRTRMAVLSVTTEDLPPASFLEVFLGRAVRPLDADLLTSADAARAWDAIGAWAARPDAFGCLTAVLGSGEREG